MHKKILLILMLNSTLISFSQEEIKSFKNYLKTTSSFLKDVIPIVNKNNHEISLFLIDSKKVYGYLLNKNFEISSQLISEDRSRKYKLLIGSSISHNNDYRVYITNKKQDKFASINFSYKNSNSSFKEFKFENENEKFIQTVTYKNKFYLISIVKNSSILKIYSFDDNANYVIEKIDLSEDRFINAKNKKTSLYNLLTISTGAYGLGKSIDIKKIEENNPNSIEVTSEYTKLYLKENKLLFSFDVNKNFTQIVSINLETFEKQLKRVKKPFENVKLSLKKTNSYINGDYIYMIASTKEKFTFIINDYNTGNLLKEYSASVKDTISFKNTPIIQKGGMYDGYRELEKTQKFLRKITAGDVGISVYKTNYNYQISLGGKQDIKSGGGMMMPMGFGMPVASFGAVTVFFNPTFFAYNSYTTTKSIHIKGLFDLNFNHVSGDVQDNVFDKIKNFKEKESYLKSGRTLFKYKDYYILGDYYSGSKKYILRKFQD